MDKNRQVKMITDLIRSGEKKVEDFKLGVEIEHFVVWEDTLKTVSYYGENGVESTLKELMSDGWAGKYEGEYLLALEKDDLSLTLEPGSQLEISIAAKRSIEDIEKSYLRFLGELLPVLEKKGQLLVSLGYHPVTRIEEIKLLPKKRYDLMFNYFKKRGSHAHNMMKGTGAFQVSIDYSSESDYVKKFRVLNALAPVFYGIFENALFFEGEPCKTHNLRAYVWMNCDNDRAGTVKEALEDDFSYSGYASYILGRPPIFTIRGGEIIPTGEAKISDILDPDSTNTEELEHLMTMFFPDARTKRYIEIRMMDSIPYPLNLAAVALIKGLFYSESNLDELYDFSKSIKAEDIIASKLELLEKGMGARLNGKTILEIGKWMIQMSKNVLSDEAAYIEPLERLLNEEINPYLFTKELYKEGDRRKAIDWAVLRR